MLKVYKATLSHYHIHIIISHYSHYVKRIFIFFMNAKKILAKQFTFILYYVIIFVYCFFEDGKKMQIIKLNVGETLELKKNHPCGGKTFKVLRVGSDVRIVCLQCGRDMTLDRIKLEKSIKNIVSE